jgi:hypothetical protein
MIDGEKREAIRFIGREGFGTIGDIQEWEVIAGNQWDIQECFVGFLRWTDFRAFNLDRERTHLNCESATKNCKIVTDDRPSPSLPKMWLSFHIPSSPPSVLFSLCPYKHQISCLTSHHLIEKIKCHPPRPSFPLKFVLPFLILIGQIRNVSCMLIGFSLFRLKPLIVVVLFMNGLPPSNASTLFRLLSSFSRIPCTLVGISFRLWEPFLFLRLCTWCCHSS